MNNIITEYIPKANEYKMVYATATLDDKFMPVKKDTRYTKLVGDRECLPISELIHPEDVQGFFEAANASQKCVQSLNVRFLTSLDGYRAMNIIITYVPDAGNMKDGYYVQLTELFSITEKYLESKANLDKYREFLALMGTKLIEYSFDTQILSVYVYSGRKSHMLLRERLDVVSDRVREDACLTELQREEYLTLADSLIYGKKNIKFELCGATLIPGDELRYEVRLNKVLSTWNPCMVAGVMIPLDGQEEIATEFKDESSYDPGTGLLNKKAIKYVAQEQMELSDSVFDIAIVDVDNFKKINDSRGHLFGDQVLAKIADILSNCVGASGNVGRFGGDEFMVVFDTGTASQLVGILESIKTAVDYEFRDLGDIKVTLSVGTARYPADGKNYDEVFLKADKAVYIAKSLGKNRYIIYDDDLHKNVIKQDGKCVGIGQRGLRNFEEKSYIISDLMSLLHEKKLAVLPDIFKQINYVFDINGTVAYGGEGLKRIAYYGDFKEPFEDLACVNHPEYQRYFESHGWCEISKLVKLEKCPEAFEKYTRQESTKLMHCEKLVEGKAVVVISFECFNRAPRYSPEDLGLIRLIGRAIVETIYEETNKK